MRKTEVIVYKYKNASNPNEIGKDTYFDTRAKLNNRTQTEWLEEQVESNRLRKEKEAAIEKTHEQFENQRQLYEESINNRHDIGKRNLAMELAAQNRQLAEEKKKKEAEDKETERQNDLVSTTLAQIEQPVDFPQKATAADSNEYLGLPRN